MTKKTLEVGTLTSLSFSFLLPLSFNLIKVTLLSPEVKERQRQLAGFQKREIY